VVTALLVWFKQQERFLKAAISVHSVVSRLRHALYSVIKVNRVEIHCDDVEWIEEARYMGQGLDPVTVVTNIQN
jgi:hypothetical protein